MLIQIIMVGLIIAFPGIVSGELDKPKAVDMEQIRLQMEADVNKSESAQDAYGAGADAKPGSGAGLMPEPEAIEPPAVDDKDLFKPAEGAASDAKK